MCWHCVNAVSVNWFQNDDFVSSETESVGMAHCEAAKKIDELDRRVKAFRDDQKTERAKVRHTNFCYHLIKGSLLPMVLCRHSTVSDCLKI